MYQSVQVSTHIAVINGQPTTTTRDIAEVYGKQHAKVLAVVRQRMTEAGEWGVANFSETPYINPQNGETYQVIRMTKKGFHFVVGKFTGAKAVVHQIAFADEFERMEAALSAKPATISPAQAQHLRELVQLVVETGKQGHGETWNRLHRKMQVNSYLQLRPDQFDEACNYLRGKFDDTSIAAIASKHFPQLAQLTQGSGRWLHTVYNGTETYQRLPNDVGMFRYEDMPELIKDPDQMIGADLLAAIGQACIQRLQQKFNNLKRPAFELARI